MYATLKFKPNGMRAAEFHKFQAQNASSNSATYNEKANRASRTKTMKIRRLNKDFSS